MSTSDSFIIDAIRTPIGNFGGTLKEVRADDLAAITIKEIIRRTCIDPRRIDDIILGCANQAGEDNRNVSRMALLLAGVPYSVPGETINRLCASGMSSVIHAHRAIQSGDGDLLIAGGVENMTRGPWVISKASKPSSYNLCGSTLSFLLWYSISLFPAQDSKEKVNTKITINLWYIFYTYQINYNR